MKVPNSSSAETEAVLANIHADGSFDALRGRLVGLLKASPNFQEQVRKQMVETIARQSPGETLDSKQLMEQLRSDEEHNNALREVMLSEIWRLLDSEPGISGAMDDRVQEAVVAVRADGSREPADSPRIAGRRSKSAPMLHSGPRGFTPG